MAASAYFDSLRRKALDQQKRQNLPFNQGRLIGCRSPWDHPPNFLISGVLPFLAFMPPSPTQYGHFSELYQDNPHVKGGGSIFVLSSANWPWQLLVHRYVKEQLCLLSRLQSASQTESSSCGICCKDWSGLTEESFYAMFSKRAGDLRLKKHQHALRGKFKRIFARFDEEKQERLYSIVSAREIVSIVSPLKKADGYEMSDLLREHIVITYEKHEQTQAEWAKSRRSQHGSAHPVPGFWTWFRDVPLQIQAIALVSPQLVVVQLLENSVRKHPLHSEQIEMGRRLLTRILDPQGIAASPVVVRAVIDTAAYVGRCDILQIIRTLVVDPTLFFRNRATDCSIISLGIRSLKYINLNEVDFNTLLDRLEAVLIMLRWIESDPELRDLLFEPYSIEASNEQEIQGSLVTFLLVSYSKILGEHDLSENESRQFAQRYTEILAWISKHERADVRALDDDERIKKEIALAHQEQIYESLESLGIFWTSLTAKNKDRKI